MANPNWKKGGSSPNPHGRRKYKNSSQTVKGKIERFLKQNMSITELNRMYGELNSKERFTLLIELLPYVTPKQTSASLDVNVDRMTDAEVESMYVQLFSQVNKKLSLEDVQEAEIIPLPEMIPFPEPEKLHSNDSE